MTLGSAGKVSGVGCVSAGSAPRPALSPRSRRRATRWIWVLRCWNNWPRCGLSKTVKPSCLPGGKCWQNVATAAARCCGNISRMAVSGSGGLSYWIELPGMLATQLAARAETTGIIMGTGTRFGLSGAFDRYLRMPFSLSPPELEEALLRIKPLWRALNKSVAPVKRSLV